MSKIFLEVNGAKYEGFKSLNFFKGIEHASGTFAFTATSELRQKLPFKGQEKCRIVLDNQPLITGFIDTVDYEYDDKSHTVSITGRDKTADIIDDSIQGNVDFRAGIALQTIIYETLGLLNIRDILVVNNVTDLKPFTQSEMAVAKVGENAFDFLEKYCRKRGVLLTTDGEGNLVITRAGQEILSGVLVNAIDGRANNTKNGKISYDFTKRYNKYIVRSQANQAIDGVDVAAVLPTPGQPDDLTDYQGTVGIAFDREIRSSRVLEMIAETASVNESNQQRAIWEANIRRARSLVYSCEVNSLYTTAAKIYEPNKKIKVKDDFCKIDSIMLIRSVTYSLDPDSGTSVKLELVPSDAYTLEASRNILLAQYDKMGED